MSVTDAERHPLLCHRCGAELTPGEGNFHVVRIEAVADPSPPNITEEDLQADFSEAIERILDELRDVPEQELMDQVYRRMTIHLCSRCYATWIEDPAG
jgi:ribosomal protein L40E